MPWFARSTAVVIGWVLGAWAPGAAAHVPHDHVPLLELSPAFERDGTLFASLVFTDHRYLGRSTDGGRSWSVSAPAVALQVLTAFAFSPDFERDGTAFAGTLVGGVFRTRDAGLTWEPLELGLGFLNVRHLAVSPDFAGDRTLAAATSLGCLVSRDGGDTWSAANSGLTETDVSVVAFDHSGQRLYAGQRTLHFSADAAGSWQPLSTLPAPMLSLAMRPGAAAAEGGLLAMSFGAAGEGVWVSSDGGLTAGPMSAGLTDLRVNQVTCAGDGTLFATNFAQGVLRADGPGAPWQVVFDGLQIHDFELTSQTDNHFRTVRVSPDFPRDAVVFCGSFEGLLRSDDRGDSWREQETYGLNLLRALALPDDFGTTGRFFAGSYGGGLLSAAVATADSAPDTGPAALSSDWSASATGVVLPFSGSMALSPDYSEDHTVFWAYNALYRSRDGGRTLEKLPRPEPFYPSMRALAVSPDFTRDRTLMVGTGGSSCYRSLDAGDSWSLMLGLPADTGARRFVFSPDHADSGTLWLATANHGVQRSDDRGQHWSLVGLAGHKLRCLAVSPDFVADRTLAAGTERLGLWISRDAGATWDPSAEGLPPSPVRGIEDVVFSPDHARDGCLFLTTSEGGVWRSDDRGGSWIDAGQGLPAQAGRKLAISPDFARDRTLLQTNFDWIWISRDAGGHWSRLPGWLRADNDHQRVEHSGAWSLDDPLSQVDFANGTHSTLTPGASTALEFLGHQVTWFARRGPDLGGIAEVSVDGRVVGRVSLHAVQPEAQVPVFQLDLPRGWHRIEVTHSGRQDPAGSSGLIRSDGFAWRF